MARQRQRGATLARSGPGAGPLVLMAMVVIVPIGLAFMLDGSTYDTWGAFVWGPFLLFLALPICRWVANRTQQPEIAGFLFGAAALKIVIGATTRYYMVDAVYGAGDSLSYDNAAAELVEPFRRGTFGGLGEVTGTRFLEIVNGLVQAIIGETMVGTFLVFSFFGFVGLCLLYVAFCEALPDGDRVLYRRLLFLTPTLWFWPSSVGKEAFLMLSIGVVAYGLSRLLHGHLGGAVMAGLGLWGAGVVRPHIALMLVVGAIAALPPARDRGAERQVLSDQPRSRALRKVAPLLIVLALPLMLGSVESYFGIDSLNVDSATEFREEVVRRTSQGGSEFVPPDTSGPPGLAQGLVTVIARPFPWEADGFQRLAAIEAVVLAAVALVAMQRRGLDALRAVSQRWPRFALVYVLAFAWGFSAVGNFGILARQRSLMLPFVFVLVAAATRPAVPPGESSHHPVSGATAALRAGNS